MVKKRPTVIKSKKKVSSASSNDESESASSSPSGEVQVAVKEMKFRNRRGERLQSLITREAKFDNPEDENFWNNNKYFGEMVKECDLDDNESFNIMEDQKMDSYDSDFGRDDNSRQEQKSEEEQVEGDEKEDRKKRNMKMMLGIKKGIKRVQFHKSLDELRVGQPVTNDEISSVDEEQKKNYVHEYCTQEQLLKEAAETEAKNMESLHNLIMIEAERRRVHFRARTQAVGPVIKRVQQVASGPTDFDDRPHTQVKSVIKLMQIAEGPPVDLFAPQRIPKLSRGFKYRDPLTRQEYNTVEEFKKLRKNHFLKVKAKQMQQLQAIEALIKSY